MVGKYRCSGERIRLVTFFQREAGREGISRDGCGGGLPWTAGDDDE